MLQQVYKTLVKKYTDDSLLPEMFWAEIERHYTQKKRHYHSLAHLEHLLEQLTNVKDLIADWDTVLFSLFYHDIIYKSTRQDNEEKSAAVAENRLSKLSFPPDKIEKCVSQILATKGHSESSDTDTNFFTDADLSILGQSWKVYFIYYQQVRKEYSIYPDLIYNPGRKKVLQHFLNMDRIYKTQYFYDHLEDNARKNMMNELEILQTIT